MSKREAKMDGEMQKEGWRDGERGMERWRDREILREEQMRCDALTFMANSWTLSPAHTGCVCASTRPATQVYV